MNAEELGLTEQQFEALRSKNRELKEAIEAWKKDASNVNAFVTMNIVATEFLCLLESMTKV